MDFGFGPFFSPSNHLHWVSMLAAPTDWYQINPERSQIYTPLLEGVNCLEMCFLAHSFSVCTVGVTTLVGPTVVVIVDIPIIRSLDDDAPFFARFFSSFGVTSLKPTMPP